MGSPMRIRATMQGDVADVKVLMNHEMETGQRKDSSGKLVPAHHITEVTASLNGKPAMKAMWGPAISRNPFLSFKLSGAQKGDKVSISWIDNKGDTRTDETVIS